MSEGDNMAKARKTREYRRLSEADRAAQAAEEADRLRIALIGPELTVAQLEAVPEGERQDGWQEQRDAAQTAYEAAARDVEVTERKARALRGFSRGELSARERAVQRETRAQIEGFVVAWEGTMAAHERHLERLDEVPEGERAAYRDAEGRTWDEAEAFHEDSLDVHERAVGVAEERLKAEPEPEAEA